MEARKRKPAPPHFVQKANRPIRLLAGPDDQAIASVFLPSGQRKRGRKDDRIREREWSESNKETGHETYPKLFERDQAVVSTHRTQVFGMSSHLARGGGGVQTHGDYPGRSDQAEPCGLSLPGPAVRGAHTDLSQRGSRCAGLAPLHLWARHCVAGGTTTPEGAPDRR